MEELESQSTSLLFSFSFLPLTERRVGLRIEKEGKIESRRGMFTLGCFQVGRIAGKSQ